MLTAGLGYVYWNYVNLGFKGIESLDKAEECVKKALNWLEHAAERGNFNYPFFNEYDPFLENIRGEPRFKKLMERIKREWKNFEV